MSFRTTSEKMRVKVYLVVQNLYAARDGKPNQQIIAARLTQRAANEIVENTPGTFIQKVYATK